MKTYMRAMIILTTMCMMTGCIKPVDDVKNYTDIAQSSETIVSETELTTENETVTESETTILSESETEETEPKITELTYDSMGTTEHIAYYDDTDVKYRLIPYDERGSLDYNTKVALFKQYGDTLNSICSSLLDITGDGVPDILGDFTDEEQIKYSIIDGVTYEIIPEFDTTFDFYDRGGAVIASTVKCPDGSDTFLLIHRQSTLYSENNKVYNQVKDIRGDTFGFYSYMPKERERMCGSTGKRGMLYDSEDSVAEDLKYYGDGGTSNFKEKGVEGKDYIKLWGGDVVQFDINGNIWYNVYMSGNRVLTEEQVDMWMGEQQRRMK